MYLVNQCLWDNPETPEILKSMRIATAEWANPEQVEQSYPYNDGTVWLGRSCGENNTGIGCRDDRHVCLVSGSRGGKGTTSIINNLILWPGSLFVIDPKGENATIAAARRGRGSEHAEGLGQEVRVLDPFKSAQIDDSLRGRFNPLDALDPEDEETIDEAGRIADAIVVIHEANDPFWDESARAMVKALLLHVLTAPEYEGRRNLVTLRKLITRGDWEAVEALRSAGEQDIPPAHGLLWTALANNPAFDGLVAGTGESFTNMLLNSPKQYESVLQVANRNTEFIDSPAMQRCLGASDFRISDLKTSPEGLSVFLCLPQRYMSTHYRWLRMMIALTVTEMEKVKGRPATGCPVLMMLDEFAGLKRMEVIEYAVAQIAGYGVKLFFVLQSLEQLKAVYKDNWETFLANSGLKIFFNLEDHFSREYVSKLIGETEVVREVRSSSDSVSESESTSRSTTRSRSETRGHSLSTGLSETDGTNSSVSKGQSGSKSRTVGWNWNRSDSENWTPGFIFRTYDKGGSEGKSEGESLSKSKSRGWNTGESQGVSHSASRSRTDGTSESWTEGTSQTAGVTQGWSASRTAGTSETIQKRALITPDEIGQMFARLDDREHPAYPGLALVVISGARPLAVRRVNYYDDYRFIGQFDAHPDHRFIESREMSIDGSDIGVLLKKQDLHIGQWFITPSQVVAGSDKAATVVTEKIDLEVAAIRVPRAGLISAVPGKSCAGGIPRGPLFSLRYYEDGAPLTDPFAEITAFCNQANAVTEMGPEKERLAAKILLFAAVAVVLLVLAFVMTRGGTAPVAPAVVQPDVPAAPKGGGGRVVDDKPGSIKPEPRPMPSPVQITNIKPEKPPDDADLISSGVIRPPTGAAERTSPKDDDVISGGIVTPPPAEIKVGLCVPADLVDRYAYGEAKRGEEMAAFEKSVGSFVRSHGTTQVQVIIRENAWDIFDRGWRSGYIVPGEQLADVVAAGNPCPDIDYTYNFKIRNR
jgi:type IV secretory pathway TraG/TraD family ATPase VirD4